MNPDPATILAALRQRLEAESASEDLSDYGAGRRELADDLLDLIDSHLPDN